MNAQRGVSLIEVLIALTIFSVAVLGVARTQWRAQQETRLAEVRGFAAWEAWNLSECLRAQRTATRAAACWQAWDAALATRNLTGRVEVVAGRTRIIIRSDESVFGGSATTDWTLETLL
jgi:type IV pilus modification protein PilV